MFGPSEPWNGLTRDAARGTSNAEQKPGHQKAEGGGSRFGSHRGLAERTEMRRARRGRVGGQDGEVGGEQSWNGMGTGAGAAGGLGGWSHG